MVFRGLSLIILAVIGISLLLLWRRKLRQAEPDCTADNKLSHSDHAQIERMVTDKDVLASQQLSCDSVDREEMLRDPELAPLLHRFEAGLVTQLETWRELLQKEDWAELQRLMHRLQGAAGVYCHSQLSEASRQAESALKELRLDNFKMHFQCIEQYIKSFTEMYLKNPH